jgi:dCMP deaminase
LVGIEADNGSIVEKARPCKICCRLIINAGIKTVKILESDNHISVLDVADFIAGEELDLGKLQGY